MTEYKISLKSALLRIYGRMLHLYPGAFYHEFGAEMAEVFTQALETGLERSLASGLLVFSRELWDLPHSLLCEYRQPPEKRGASMAESNPTQLARQTQPGHPGWSKPAASWGDAILAGLPYLLVLLASLPQYLASMSWFPQGSRLLGLLQGVTIFATILFVLAAFVLAWRRKWPSWMGTYIFVFLLALLYPLLILFSALQDRYGWLEAYDAIQFVILPLVVGVVIYLVTRSDRLKGLLAAFPVVFFLWGINMEFVPGWIRATITVFSLAMIALAAIFAVRIGEWRTALFLMLVTNAAVGIFFSYAGIYHGGSLPYTAPGPSPLEVLKIFINFYVLSVSLWLGPLLACMFRDIGRRSGRDGKISYRVTLLGLLLVIMINISGVYVGTSDLKYQHPELYTYLGWLLYLGLGLYLVGLVWLFWSARKAGKLPDPLTLVLLSLLPLFLPIGLALPFILGSTRLISSLFGIPQIFTLPETLVYVVTIVWICLTVWLVTREARLPAQPEVLLQPG